MTTSPPRVGLATASSTRTSPPRHHAQIWTGDDVCRHPDLGVVTDSGRSVAAEKQLGEVAEKKS
ncbi:UNVERIFIED_CONTAM: hypothetical protein Slati_0820400 [Sesamum latifolium]|uniref:Uncharacterized protein n=1 Tax=Sesamum latifolium TaxID=2727402 RepID=A0AAW2XKV0_9LAMI